MENKIMKMTCLNNRTMTLTNQDKVLVRANQQTTTLNIRMMYLKRNTMKKIMKVIMNSIQRKRRLITRKLSFRNSSTKTMKKKMSIGTSHLNSK